MREDLGKESSDSGSRGSSDIVSTRDDGPLRIGMMDDLPGSPIVIPRDKHCLSRKFVDPDALRVLRRFIHHGYQAFLVGGSVRDILLGKEPKDFDISTNATPSEIRDIFRNCRIIGRRFRLAHIFFHRGKILEASTFRSEGEAVPEDAQAGAPSDNVYGDAQTDARRRDLTINGLFYDLRNYAIIDYVGGLEDLRAGVVRVIGDPETRFREDPVRMIRAVRHAARTGFEIEPKTYEAIKSCKAFLSDCSQARLYEEFIRELKGGQSLASVGLMMETGLLDHFLPAVSDFSRSELGRRGQILERTLTRVDDLIRKGEDVPLSLILAAMLIGTAPVEGLLKNHGEGLEHVGRQFLSVPEDSHSHFDCPEDGVSTDYKSRRDKSAQVVAGDAGLALGRLVSEIFHPIGVSRKDRDAIESVLYGRHILLDGQQQPSGRASRIVRKSYFRDALLLLEISGHDSRSMEAASFWRASLKSSTGKRRRSRHRKRISA